MWSIGLLDHWIIGLLDRGLRIGLLHYESRIGLQIGKLWTAICIYVNSVCLFPSLIVCTAEHKCGDHNKNQQQQQPSLPSVFITQPEPRHTDPKDLIALLGLYSTWRSEKCCARISLIVL